MQTQWKHGNIVVIHHMTWTQEEVSPQCRIPSRHRPYAYLELAVMLCWGFCIVTPYITVFRPEQRYTRGFAGCGDIVVPSLTVQIAQWLDVGFVSQTHNVRDLRVECYD